MSGASEQASGRANGPVLTSRFLAHLNHCAPSESITGYFHAVTYRNLGVAFPTNGANVGLQVLRLLVFWDMLKETRLFNEE